MENGLAEHDITGETAKSKVSVEEIVRIAQKAENEWLATMRDPKMISDHIVRILQSRLEDVVAGALGFDNHWGRWEVKNTNGREPAIVTAISAQCKASAKEIVASALQTYKPKAEISRLVQKEYDSALKEAVREMAREVARENALQLVSDTLNAPITKLQKAFQALESND